MSALTNVQIINGIDGNPAFVVIPYADYLKEHASETATIPNEVVGAVIKQEITPIKAWREYLQLPIAKIAEQLNISEADYIKLENLKKPSKSTLKKVSGIFGITVTQLDI